jgi:hypothetical protein
VGVDSLGHGLRVLLSANLCLRLKECPHDAALNENERKGVWYTPEESHLRQHYVERIRNPDAADGKLLAQEMAIVASRRRALDRAERVRGVRWPGLARD